MEAADGLADVGPLLLLHVGAIDSACCPWPGEWDRVNAPLGKHAFVDDFRRVAGIDAEVRETEAKLGPSVEWGRTLSQVVPLRHGSVNSK